MPEVVKLIDQYTGELVSYEQTNVWINGTPMDDTKVDGVIYRKAKGDYYKRNFSGTLDIRWFGATNDDTTDNSTSFQRAISFVKSISIAKWQNIPSIYIPQGDWKITQTLYIDFSGFRMHGQGRHTSRLKYEGTGTVIKIGDGPSDINASLFDIHDLSITDALGTAKKGIHLSHATEGLIERIRIMGNDNGVGFSEEALSLYAFGVNGNWTNRFFDIRVTRTSGVGFYIGGSKDTTNTLANNNANFFINCSATFTKWGLFCSGLNGAKFVNFQSESSSSGSEIRISPYENNGAFSIQQLTLDNLYVEAGQNNSTIYIGDEDPQGNYPGFVRFNGIRISNPYIIGGNYVLEIHNNHSSLIEGMIDGGYYGQVNTAFVDSSNSLDRIFLNSAPAYNSSLMAIPFVTNDTSGVFYQTVSGRGLRVGRPIELAEYTTQPVSVNKWAIWGASIAKRMRVANDQGVVKTIPFIEQYSSVPATTDFQRSTGAAYWDTTQKSWMVWDAGVNAFVAAIPAATSTTNGTVKKSAALTAPAATDLPTAIARIEDLITKLQAAGIQS